MSQTVEYDPFVGAELEQVIPATAAQQEIWAAARLGSDASCAFNESVSLRLRGNLDVAALQRTLARLVDRHEALRGTFSPDDGRFCIAASIDIPLSQEDVSNLMPARQQERLLAVRTEEVETPFDLEQGPLLRARLLRTGAREHYLILTAHHIICDGWSMAVMLRDLALLYSPTHPSDDAVPQAQPFSEYARWIANLQGTAAQRQARHYWLDQLRGELPALELPTDRPRQRLRSYRAARHDHALSPNLVQPLKKVGAGTKASFFTVLLTSFAAFLSRLTGQEDLVIGVPAAGQSASGMENVVGHCVNLLPIRCTIKPAAPFLECLKQLRTHVLDAYDHQQVTYGELLPDVKFRRDPSRPPLVAVSFNLDQAVQAKDMPFAELEVEYTSNPRHFENFELFINASEAAGRVVLECQYNADLFDAETIRDRMESFEALLTEVAAQPSATIAQLPLLSQAQQKTILIDWNATALDYPRNLTIGQLFQQQVARSPERPALTVGAVTWTYGELERWANRLAHYLQALGVGRGTLVGLCMERTAELIVGQLAILKAGAGYLPLDPKYPRDRIAFMMTDSSAGFVLTQEKWLDLFPADTVRAICPERAAAAIADQSDTAPACAAEPRDTAYVIYTSGSTGMPKGVAVLHQGVVNLIHSMRDRPGIGDQDTLLAVTTLSFDMSVTETLLPLCAGACVVLASQEAVSDGMQLLRLLQSSGATIMQGTPSTWRLLLSAGWRGGQRLSAWCGGEALTPDLARAILNRSQSLWNLYGPTEATVYSTGGQVFDPEHVHIGGPIANSQCYILDAHGEPTPVGVPGELFLGGAGVAAGYLHRPEMTAQRFVDNPYHDPFADYPNPRLYHTGDLVRWQRDGTIEYLGRNDHQVKLRGFRIEPGEIETALAALSSVRQAVVTVRSDRADDPRLVAYFVTTPGRTTTTTELRKHLRSRLPEYMVPQHFVEVDALPLTANGKVDRGQLPSPFGRPTRSDARAPL